MTVLPLRQNGIAQDRELGVALQETDILAVLAYPLRIIATTDVLPLNSHQRLAASPQRRFCVRPHNQIGSRTRFFLCVAVVELLQGELNSDLRNVQVFFLKLRCQVAEHEQVYDFALPNKPWTIGKVGHQRCQSGSEYTLKRVLPVGKVAKLPVIFNHCSE